MIKAMYGKSPKSLIVSVIEDCAIQVFIPSVVSTHILKTSQIPKRAYIAFLGLVLYNYLKLIVGRKS